MSSPSIQKLDHLRSVLEQMGSVLICFSGGIDSAFLLKVAHEVLGSRAIGMTAVSPSLPQRERKAAVAIAQEIGADHRLVESNEMTRPGYVENRADRCFHCKSELYTIAEQKRLQWNLNAIANGTILDDLGDYRPGLEAAKNAQVRAPLVEAEMGKHDVRECAQLLGMEVWDKPAAACLSSRIPYGSQVTRERLAQIEALEDALRALGFPQVRVRWHEKIARIEVPPEALPRLLNPETLRVAVEVGKAQGFQYVTADLEGYRTGSMNEVLSGRSLKILQS